MRRVQQGRGGHLCGGQRRAPDVRDDQERTQEVGGVRCHQLRGGVRREREVRNLHQSQQLFKVDQTYNWQFLDQIIVQAT